MTAVRTSADSSPLDGTPTAEKIAAQFPEYSQARGVFDELTAALIRQHAADSDRLTSALEYAAQLVGDVRDVLNPAANKTGYQTGEYLARLSKHQQEQDQAGILWRFPDAARGVGAGTSSSDYWPVDNEELTRAAVRYLRSPMRSAQLERIMAAALIYQEVLGFGEHIKENPPLRRGFWGAIAAATVKDNAGTKIGNRIAIVQAVKSTVWFVAALAVGIAAWDRHGWWIGVLAGFGAFVLFCLYRLIDTLLPIITQVRVEQLFLDMQAVSTLVRQHPLSPRYLRQRLYDTAAKGAVWPSALMSLVELACERNPVDWTTERLADAASR